MTDPNPSPAPFWLVPVLVIGIPIFYFCIAAFVLKILALVGGWSSIARRFPRRQPPQGKTFSGCSGMFGFVGYNHCLKVTVSPEGIDIAPPWILFMAHPPLYIPWSEIYEPRPENMFFQKRVRFKVGSPKIGSVSLPAKIFAESPIPGAVAPPPPSAP